MPVTNGRGHSEQTAKKQEGLCAILEMHLNTCKTILAQGWPYQIYQYIDTNAGPGHNAEHQCDGSPIVFLKAAEKIKIPYKAAFIEIDPANAFMLRIMAASWNGWEVHAENNRDILPDLVKTMPPKSFGTIYMDPNGIPDFELLTEISRLPRMRYIDIVIRYCATASNAMRIVWTKNLLTIWTRSIKITGSSERLRTAIIGIGRF